MLLDRLRGHASPCAVGEAVWDSSEAWIAALARLARDPRVLLAEIRDWASLLDRHSVARADADGADTAVRWGNVPGVSSDRLECELRLGALRGLLGFVVEDVGRLDVEHSECLTRGDEDCVFRVYGWVPRGDPVHSDALREALLMTAGLQGYEAINRRLARFAARTGPFPDVAELHAVRRFMEEIEDIILILDRDLWVLDANSAAVRLTGIARNELRGLSARDLMDPDSYRRVCRFIPLLFERGALSGLTITGRFRRRDVPLEVSARVAGNGQSVVCIARDISRYLELERELEHRNRLLEAQNRRIVEADRLKSEFLANVSHELSTPLTCIQGFARMLCGEIESRGDRGRTLAPGKREEFLGIIQAEAHRMGELISGLLELAKIESGVVTLDRVSVCLNDLVRDCLRVLGPRFAEGALKVVAELEPDLGRERLDPHRIKQVVLNLLENAIKFSPQGAEIRIRTESSSSARRIRVRNRSHGLRQGDLTRIFQRFVQRDGSFSREYGGVGLGLNLVRAIVELHGGRVWADLLGADTVEFTAELPRAVQASAARSR